MVVNPAFDSLIMQNGLLLFSLLYIDVLLRS